MVRLGGCNGGMIETAIVMGRMMGKEGGGGEKGGGWKGGKMGGVGVRGRGDERLNSANLK